jgi:DNA-binding SARP family transcriptional activator
LAELRFSDERHEAAVGALERAIELDQICEDAYRRLIDLRARLGHSDAAARTWRRLQVRLAELDLDPEPATEMLVRQALSSHARPLVRVADGSESLGNGKAPRSSTVVNSR